MAQVFNHALLLKVRLELSLTQEQVASAAGVDVRTYRRYESGAVNDPVVGFSVRHATRRRVLERLCAELGIPEAELLVDAPSPADALAAGDPAPSDKVFRPLHLHTLQRARHFVGRKALLDLLAIWMAEAQPAHRIVALVAVGGTGKTAAVERFLEHLGDAAQPGGVLVWSFYDDPRVESFLSSAAAYFAPAEPAASSAESHAGDRFERLCAALRRGPPHLLVLDGLETVQAEGGSGRAHGELTDTLLRRLLCAIARGLGSTRALVTSRFELADLSAWENGALRTIRLASLSEDEEAVLLRRWGIKADPATLRGLHARTGGHALSVAMVGSYVGAFLGGDPRRLDAAPLAEAARDDVLARRLHAVLSAYARALPNEERDLLARLSVFPAGAPEGALLAIARAGGAIAGSLAGWDASDLRRSLARLERLGLVFSAREGQTGYSTHPFLRQHFKSLLGVAPDQIQAVNGPRLDTTPRSPPQEQSDLDAYEDLLGRLLDAGRPLDAYGIYARSLGGFNHLGLRLGAMSRGSRIVRAFAEDGDPLRFPASLPMSVRAALAYDAGLYEGALGDLAFACRCYTAHNAIAEDLGEPTVLATGLRTLSYTERLRGNLSSARRHIERSIAIAEGVDASAHVVRGVALLASILHDMGEVRAADEHFNRLRAMGGRPVARRGLWEAEHDLALGRREAARAATQKNLETCAELRWEGHVAHCRTVLGLLAMDEDVEAARDHLERARVWTNATGEVEVVLRCHDLAARVGLASTRLDEAAREAADGLHLAETCGFALWRSRLAVLALRCAWRRDPGEAAVGALAALAATGPEDAWGRADALHWAGIAAAGANDMDRARSLLGDAAALRERILHPDAASTRRALESLDASMAPAPGDLR